MYYSTVKLHLAAPKCHQYHININIKLSKFGNPGAELDESPEMSAIIFIGQIIQH